jgi:hypothetical protein
MEIHWYTRHVKNGAEVYLLAASATTEQGDNVLKKCVDRFALMRSWWLGASESGELLVTFQGHTGTAVTAVFSPEGQRVRRANRSTSTGAPPTGSAPTSAPAAAASTRTATKGA